MTDEKTNTAPQQPGPAPTEAVQNVMIPHRLNVASDIGDMASWLFAMNNPGMITPETAFALVPDKVKLLDLESLMPFPRHLRKKLSFTDSKSFLHYFHLFKNSYMPRLFCRTDDDGFEALCVFDYDGPGDKKVIGEGEKQRAVYGAPQAMWNGHQSRLSLAYHPDYAALREQDSDWLSQQDFALFIEENTHLFKNPDGATMLELAQHLKGVRNANWQSGKRLANGETKLEYIETLEAKSARHDLNVPDRLTIVSPIFEGYPAQEYQAAFRWRMVDGGRIEFSYRLLTKLAERDALEAVKDSLVKETGLPLYNVSDFNGITRA